MLTGLQSADILRTIQAAIAPVVLISAIGLLLLTLTARLGRIVDRSRLLAAERRAGGGTEALARIDDQLTILSGRARLVRLAVALSATAIGLSGVLVVVLFVSMLLQVNVALIAAMLFIASMLSLVFAMLAFVRELFLALRALDVEMGHLR